MRPSSPLVVANGVLLAAAFSWLGLLSSRPATTHTRTVVVVHQGPRGPAGARGPAGKTGATGPMGPRGPIGRPGKDGADYGGEIEDLDQRVANLEQLCGRRLVADLNRLFLPTGQSSWRWTWVSC